MSAQKEKLRGRLENATVSLMLSHSWHLGAPEFNGNHSEDVVEEKHQHTYCVSMSELC